MGISSVVDWWEEWQLRILVLGSLFVQYLLFFSAPYRKFAIPSWYRSIIWLSYLGSDALAIYALATLFSRQSKRDYSSAQGYSILEVVWAPILLIHLGGQDSITAYNIEDNELWKRHVVTAVSQITVAIYVFCKSWPGGDKRLLQAAILLFTAGILKCLDKPWSLKRSSFSSLVTLSSARCSRKSSRREEAISLEEYVQKARALHADHQCQAQEDCHGVDLELNHVPQAQGESNEVDLEGNHVRQAQGEYDEFTWEDFVREEKRFSREARNLFADLASSYPDRLAILESFLLYGDDQEAYDSLQQGLVFIFQHLYTKLRFAASFVPQMDPERVQMFPYSRIAFAFVRAAVLYLPFAAIGLFHNSHKKAYNVHDVKVTYALLCCTAALKFLPVFANTWSLTHMIVPAQNSVVGYFVGSKRHTKNLLSSSFRITMLVLRHVNGWWKEHITNVASYCRFSDLRGQQTIQDKGCAHLEWSINKPFDESVVLWHIATDLCFYQMDGTSVSHAKDARCREISNYMIYLLFATPEMLLSGTRRNLFMEANAELDEILMDDKTSLKKIIKGDMPLLMEILKGNKSFLEFFKRKGPSSEEIERGLVQIIVAKLESANCREEGPAYATSPTMEQHPAAQEGFIRDAWKIYKDLIALGDEKKMWEVIEGVWVEMLCFSASRCRGYLHAKSMGSGMELLTSVWFLLWCMGMETLPERMRRTELSSGGGNTDPAPSTSVVSTSTSEAIV